MLKGRLWQIVLKRRFSSGVNMHSKDKSTLPMLDIEGADRLAKRISVAIDETKFEVMDSFCIYPFMSLNIMPTGTAKPCCAFGTLLEEAGRPLSVYEHSISSIWNSQAMRDMRRDMVGGKPVAACEYCYNQERLGLTVIPPFLRGLWK